MSHLALTLNCKLQSTAEERRGFPNSLIHIFRSLAAPIKPAASAEVDRKTVTGVANTPSASPRDFDWARKEISGRSGD